MVFPLFRTWLKPLLGSSSRTEKQYKTPEGFRSLGGGVGDGSYSHRVRGTQGSKGSKGTGSNPLTNVTFTESEERIVNDIKLQDMKTAGTTQQGSRQSDGKGIVVLTEFDISEDRSSQHNDQHSDRSRARIQESW